METDQCVSCLVTLVSSAGLYIMQYYGGKIEGAREKMKEGEGKK